MTAWLLNEQVAENGAAAGVLENVQADEAATQIPVRLRNLKFAVPQRNLASPIPVQGTLIGQRHVPGSRLKPHGDAEARIRTENVTSRIADGP